MVTLARTQKPTDQTEVQHTNLGFSIRAGSPGNSPATALWSRTCIKCNEWHEIFFLQNLWFIYPSLYSLVFVSTNGAINCPRMQKCILRVQILRIFQVEHAPIHPHTTVMPSAQKRPSPPTCTPEVLLPTPIFTENSVNQSVTSPPQ